MSITAPGQPSSIAASRSHYERVLGVPRDADVASIKVAFRDLAAKYHPDRNKTPEATGRFREIVEAYGVLSEPDARQNSGAPSSAGAGGKRSERAGARWFSPEDLWAGLDIDGIFGERRVCTSRSASDRSLLPKPDLAGERLQLELSISLEKVATGGVESIRIPQVERCAGCRGSGAAMGCRPRQCVDCAGTGERTEHESLAGALFRRVVSCVSCGGQGRFIESPCRECAGRGEVTRETVMDVRVPPGAQDGSVLRVCSDALVSLHGEPSSDVVVVARIAADRRFTQRGTELWRNETIDIVDAVLGTQLTVPGLGGDIEVSVPPGTQPGAVLRIVGEGLPAPGGGPRGNLNVVLDVRVPDRPGADERRLYAAIRALSPGTRAESCVLAAE